MKMGTFSSSRHYIDYEIVEEEKKAEIAGMSEVVIPCSYVGFIDGIEYGKTPTIQARQEVLN